MAEREVAQLERGELFRITPNDWTPPMTSNIIDNARRIAERAHEGQDKIGAPYIQHPEMVADLVQRLPAFVTADADTQQDAIVAAWLHDVIEDTPITVDDLLSSGVPVRAVDAVVALTRTDAVAPDDYYAAISAKPVALLVKTADLASNLAPERVASSTRPPGRGWNANTPTPWSSSTSRAPSSTHCSADSSMDMGPQHLMPLYYR